MRKEIEQDAVRSAYRDYYAVPPASYPRRRDIDTRWQGPRAWALWFHAWEQTMENIREGVSLRCGLRHSRLDD